MTNPTNLIGKTGLLPVQTNITIVSVKQKAIHDRSLNLLTSRTEWNRLTENWKKKRIIITIFTVTTTITFIVMAGYTPPMQ